MLAGAARVGRRAACAAPIRANWRDLFFCRTRLHAAPADDPIGPDRSGPVLASNGALRAVRRRHATEPSPMLTELTADPTALATLAALLAASALAGAWLA